MTNIAKYAGVFLLVAAVIVVPFSAFAQVDTQYEDEGTSAGTMAYDLILIRPFGFLATVLGTTLFVVSLPITAITKETSKAYDTLVVSPAKYTFKRKLGEF